MSLKSLKAVALLFSMSVALVSCTRPGPVAPRLIVDLSPTITPDLTKRMVGEKLIADFGFRGQTEFEHIIGEDPLYYQDSYITLFNHAGTHVDSPVHVIKGGASTEEYDLSNFYGRAKVLDFSRRASDNAISIEEMKANNVQAGDIVIVYTGYEPPTGPDEYPDFTVPTAEAAEYLAGLPVKAYAVDTPSVDDLIRMFDMLSEGVQDSRQLLPVHHAFLSKGIPAIEGLVNVGAIAQEIEVVFVGFPLKMGSRGGDAGQMRAAALVY